MFVVTHTNRRMLVSLIAFILLTFAGSLLLGFTCFPSSSHSPVSLWCNISFYSPAIAAVVAGIHFGRKVAVATSPLAAFAPIIGLSILYLSGHIRYWYGQDIGAALSRAAIYCIIPSIAASAVSAFVFSRRKTRVGS